MTVSRPEEITEPDGAPSTSRRRHGRQRGGIWALADRYRWVTLLAGGAVAALLFFSNLPGAPDYDGDEALYSLAGQHIGLHGSVSWDSDPILVHPPLFFLTVGAWLSATGKLTGSIISAIHSARYLSGIFDVLIVVLVGTAAYAWSQREEARARGRVAVLAMLFTALNGFMLRFGRAVLLEPMGVCTALATLLLAWRFRKASDPVYAAVYGTALGVAALVKEPLVFIACAPLVNALLVRRRSDIIRSLKALLVGLLVWAAFPLWATLSGNGRAFYLQQTVSIRRLLGLVQITGLNRKGVSAKSAFTDTLLQYGAGYVIFAIGGVALAAGLMAVLRRRPLIDDDGATAVLSLGLLSYLFLLYSVFIGQSNEQLSVYTVPASALLAAGYSRYTARSWTRVFSPLATLGSLLALLLAGYAWYLYSWVATDNAAEQVAGYLARNIPHCVSINAAGDPETWQMTLRQNPVTGYSSGPEALRNGVHVYLLSTKDTTFQYGISNPDLAAWITAHGHQVFYRKSHTYQDYSIWLVGAVAAPVGQSTPGCVEILPPAARSASAGLFMALLGGTTALALAATLGPARLRRRRDLAP